MKQTDPYTMPRFISGLSITKKGNSTRSFSYVVNFFKKGSYTSVSKFFLVLILCVTGMAGFSQNCPTTTTPVSISANPNTYYPGITATVNVGATSITLGAVPSGYGTNPIVPGDFVLIIQMQGAEINAVNASTYGGNNSGYGNGFTTSNLLAGKMEFLIASNSVPLTGGTLNLTSGTINSYVNAAYSSFGQYRYQLIRVPYYYNIVLNASFNTPSWNGNIGGVTIISAINQLNFNGKTISAAGTGFRGGAGKRLGGMSGASGSDKNLYMTMSPVSSSSPYYANGSKAEGIAGTPRLINYGGVLVDNGVEGYPGGSFARGGPGNAGGGGTDSHPVSNDQNSGGGGGGNGNIGGGGGWGWYSAGTTGGKGGASFASYAGPSRLVMGGGGGAGTSNDGTGNAAYDGFASSGVSGGGIVIINALSITGTGSIDVSGSSGYTTTQIDGSGGGGAGGSVLIYANSGHSSITVTADGGDGGSNTPGGASQHGPGGGGSGGIIYSNGTLNAASSVLPGDMGTSNGSYFGNYPAGAGVIVETFPASQLPPKMRTCQGILLPVNLLSFGAAITSSNNVQVSWTVSNQMNLDHYQIERSVDGASFNSIGQVAASQQTEYEHIDYLTSINASIVYYRLKMIDQDGNSVYSKIIPVRLEQTTDAKTGVYPNPAVDFTVLKLYSDKQTVARIKLIDDAGRQIINRPVTVNAGNNSLMIDQLGSLPKGIYIVQVVLNNTLHNEKLIKK